MKKANPTPPTTGKPILSLSLSLVFTICLLAEKILGSVEKKILMV
jgi:hypothetical protein